MLFNSYIFLFVFLPPVLLGWWWLGRWTQVRLALVTAASYLFYGWWDWRFTGLLAVSTLVDYWVGARIATARSARARQGLLLVSLVVNLGLLGYFKYAGFLLDSANAVAAWLRLGGRVPVVDIVLPVGISFYTFQTLSYSLDLYRGQVRPARSLLHFAAYVSLFPQLVAGPIVRYQDLEDQLVELPRVPDWEQLADGIRFFVLGLAQKILLADVLASRIDPLLLQYESLRLFGAWYALIGYAFQLYFDFAGYSNMAIGLGMWLGFRFPLNFDSPYKSASIAEFWRRWHITLSQWLRDYLFIPLGGSRRGPMLTMRNLMLVMFLGGLWHGAGWTFALWGLYHGGLLAVHAAWRLWSPRPLPRAAAVPLTFLAVLLGWVLFRSTDLEMARQVVWALLGLHGVEPWPALPAWTDGWVLLVAAAIVWAAPNVSQLRIERSLATAALLAGVLVLCILRLDAESPFLYFQF